MPQEGAIALASDRLRAAWRVVVRCFEDVRARPFQTRRRRGPRAPAECRGRRPDHLDRRRAARDDAAAHLDRAEGRHGRLGCPARARRAQQPTMEGARGRRRHGHHPGPERVHLAGLVRDETRARPRGPDLELHHRPRPRPARHPRRSGLGRGQRAGPERPRTRRRASSPGRSTTRPCHTSRASSGRSSASSSSIDRVEGKWKLSQNRSDADIAGTIEGLEASGEEGVSGAMRAGRGEPA